MRDVTWRAVRPCMKVVLADFGGAVTARSKALHESGVATNPGVEVDQLDPVPPAEGARSKRDALGALLLRERNSPLSRTVERSGTSQPVGLLQS